MRHGMSLLIYKKVPSIYRCSIYRCSYMYRSYKKETGRMLSINSRQRAIGPGGIKRDFLTVLTNSL